MSRFVKQLVPIDLVIDIGIGQVTFGTLDTRFGDTIHGIGPLLDPATMLHRGEHLAAKLSKHLGILQTTEEQVAVLGESLLQGHGVPQDVIGFTEFLEV